MKQNNQPQAKWAIFQNKNPALFEKIFNYSRVKDENAYEIERFDRQKEQKHKNIQQKFDKSKQGYKFPRKGAIVNFVDRTEENKLKAQFQSESYCLYDQNCSKGTRVKDFSVRKTSQNRFIEQKFNKTLNVINSGWVSQQRPSFLQISESKHKQALGKFQRENTVFRVESSKRCHTFSEVKKPTSKKLSMMLSKQTALHKVEKTVKPLVKLQNKTLGFRKQNIFNERGNKIFMENPNCFKLDQLPKQSSLNTQNRWRPIKHDLF